MKSLCDEICLRQMKSLRDEIEENRNAAKPLPPLQNAKVPSRLLDERCFAMDEQSRFFVFIFF